MVTYVINTSENKTFDSKILFDLAGYNKIKWVQCALNDVKSCAEDIYERQNVLGADRFRIAVIIDFYSFDRIRLPYGRRGFGQETGVDMSLYMPYIELYLLDNLIGYLEVRDMLAEDFEVYYVQNEKCERYEMLESANAQIMQVLEGSGEPKIETVETEVEVEEEIPPEGRPPVDFEELKRRTLEGPKRVTVNVDKKYYKSFKLYCTSSVSLEFKMTDYPYGVEEMTFDQFLNAIRQRLTIRNHIRRHYYISSYGGGASRAAFDTLSLSLYLIRMYEREEQSRPEGEMEIIHLEATVLKDVLEEAWCKINVAREVAKKNNLDYYSLYQTENAKTEEPEEEPDLKSALIKERIALPKSIKDAKMSGEAYYSEICAFSRRTSADIKNRNRIEFDGIMTEYLKKRDETRETSIEAEFETLKEQGSLKMTKQSPSQADYENIVEQKQNEISDMFKRILAAEYIAVDYSDEQKRADAAFADYKKVRSWMHRNIIGDIIFMILAVASMIIPYYSLQLTTHTSKFFSSFTLCLMATGLFAGLFVCSVIFQLLPLMRRLNKAKKELQDCFIDCSAKERYSFSSIRRRYEKDLIYIEQTRYELRQIKQLYDANRTKNMNVRAHRDMLEILEDCLSAMLNNLDVEPKFDPDETVDGEFDLGQPIRSRHNKVYQIFSIETIEKMFPKKGRDEQ